MRIRSLHLRNFRRHADTRIELPDGVTALLGPNGAGKSSLLEGIAFALFGTDGLRTGKSLVRLEGAPPGDSVEATLELELGGQALVLHRELKGKALTPSATLTVDGAVLVPAGAGSSEAVTQQVTKRLGMGPDAFFTTIVARQGELARLANEAPAERKRLILRMVGVDRIDGAIERARERRRDAQAQAEALQRVARDPVQAEAALAEAKARSAAAADLVRRTASAWESARLAAQQAATQARDLEARVQARRVLESQLHALQQQVRERAETLRRAELDVQQTIAARDGAARLTEAAARLPALEAAWADAQVRLATARQRVVQEQALARLEAELATVQAARAGLGTPPTDEGLAPAEEALRRAETATDAARRSLAAAQALHAAAQARRTRIEALGPDAPCPTCERPLAGHLPLIHGHARTAVQQADEQVAAARVREAQAATALAAARGARDGALAKQRERDRQAAEAKTLDARLADLAARLAEAQAHLPPETLAPDGIAALRQEVAAAKQATADLQRLGGLAERLPQALETLHVARQAHESVVAQARAQEAQWAGLADPALELAQAQGRLEAAQGEERVAERAVHDAGRAEATALGGVAQAEQAVAEARRLAADLAARQAEAREWTTLADGSRGLLERFRDHVVDRIGPAVQAEASRLLAAFTGGRYTEILLDTQYNVYVTDGGVRYGLERFSGGEQDLAHLALRLAVSRLLAERAGGAELRFLALDEVFGSLDAQRRDLVVGALHGLGGLYSQVLVVSHQEALQEALDQALVVETDGGLARVRIQNG